MILKNVKRLILFIPLVSVLMACEQASTNTTSMYDWDLPEGFPKPQVPSSNPMSAEKVELGRHLFYDKNLSFNQKQACSSCHIQAYAFAEPKQFSMGATGQHHKRNAPALINIAYNKTLTWAHDGITTIEQQVLLPMFGEDPIELGITFHEKEVLARFQTSTYRQLFLKAFGDEAVSFKLISFALASFVRSLVSLNAPFDDYAYGNNDDAISAAALRGMTLFYSERLECHHCHGGFNFTQSTFHEKQLLDRRPFHNTGLYNIENIGYPSQDTGLQQVTLKAKDNGRFRAPTLRNIAITAPYMHDGSISTLSEVIDFYAAGGRNIQLGKFKGDGRMNPLKSPLIKGVTLSEQDKADLIAFLETLTDTSFLQNTTYAKPKQATIN